MWIALKDVFNDGKPLPPEMARSYLSNLFYFSYFSFIENKCYFHFRQCEERHLKWVKDEKVRNKIKDLIDIWINSTDVDEVLYL